MTLPLIFQASFLLGLALLIGAVLRRRSPALRHALSMAVLIAVLLLPLLSRFASLAPSELTAVEIPAITVTAVGRASASTSIDWVRWIERIYFFGIAVIACRYLIGMGRALWLRATSKPWVDRIHLHNSIRVPMTFGWLRPLVLLPDNATAWPEDRRDAAIAHELAHIARHDCLWNFIAEAACAVWWFHPLAWMLASRARKDAEQAADNAVLRAGMQPSDYAQHLLDVARETAGSWEFAAGIAMAEPSKLESRVVAVLDPNASRLPLSRRAFAALTSVVAVVTLLISGTITSRAQSIAAGTVEVTVVDPSGARVPKGMVSIEDGRGRIATMLGVNESGEVKFTSLPPGDYLVQVRTPGFATWNRGLQLDASSGAKIEALLAPGQIFESMKVNGGGQATAPAGPPKQIRVGGNVQAAKLRNQVRPIYPATAKEQGIQGTVFLQAVILKDGTVGSLEVLSAPHESLANAAMDAVRQWTYETTLLNGEPIEVITKVTINFTLTP